MAPDGSEKQEVEGASLALMRVAPGADREQQDQVEKAETFRHGT